MNDEQVDEIVRLASMYATARVRRFAFQRGLAQVETETGTRRRVEKAMQELIDYAKKATNER